MAPHITGDALGEPRPNKIQEWNESLPSTVERCIHQIIEEQAQQQPDAQALCSAAGSLTYKALDAYATTIARELSILGVKPDTYVALSFEHSIWAIVAMLGVLKAGAAFASVPPSPNERVETILGQLNPTAILASPSRASSLTQYPPPKIIVSEQSSAKYSVIDESQLEVQVKPNNLAYAVFTSGSTGVPKVSFCLFDPRWLIEADIVIIGGCPS